MGAGAARACVPKAVSRASRVWGAFSTSQTHSRLSALTSQKHLAWLASADHGVRRPRCPAERPRSGSLEQSRSAGPTARSYKGITSRRHLPARPTSFGSLTGDGRRRAVTRPLVAAAAVREGEIARSAAVLALWSGAHRATALGGCRLPAGPRPQTIGTLPGPGRPFYPERWLRQAGTDCSSTSSYAVVGCVRGVGSVAGRGGSSHVRLVSVSVVLLAVASWGVARTGGRRLHASLLLDPGRSGGIAKTASRSSPGRHGSEGGGEVGQPVGRRAAGSGV